VFPLCSTSSSAYGDWWASLELPLVYSSGTLYYRAPYKYRILDGVFRCPLNGGAVETLEYTVGSGQPMGSHEDILIPRFCSYGYNAFGAGSTADRLGLGGFSPLPGWSAAPMTEATRDSRVIAPSDMIALGDVFLRSINPAKDGAQSEYARIAPSSNLGGDGSPTGIPWKKQPAFLAHQRRANRAFVDGHLEAEDLRKQFAATDPELRRWNADHEPHAANLKQFND
jgi:prepilin-type processing-associated H-X9-DG protein